MQPGTRGLRDRRVRGERLAAAESLLDQTWYVLNRAAQALREAVEEALLPLGLRRRHYAALGILAAHGPLSQQELAGRIPLDRASVVLVVDDLEALEFAARNADPNDRRAHMVVLTEAGTQALQQARRRVLAAQSRLLAPLTGEEAETLDMLCRRLCGWEDAP